MIISERIKEIEFLGRTMKDAYMSCCKWLSTNVIAVNNSKHVTYKIEKVTEQGNKTVKLTLYVTEDEQEIRDKHCEVCKEVTGSFFLTQNKHMCESCRVVPYRRRIEDRLKMLKEGLKGKIL